MKKTLSCISCFIVFLFIIFCTGCRHTYPFQQEHSEIASVEIVSLKYVSSLESEPEEVVICNIENISEFMSDFSEMDIETVSPPKRPESFQTPTIIKITYHDGTFEQIAPMGSMVRRPDGFQNFYGVNTFDNEEFSALVEKYVGTTPIELEYNFLLPETKITSVEIVKLGMSEYWYESPKEQYSICQIENITDFLKRFSEVDCFLNVAPPTKVEDESIVFKISYADDCYELIGVNGQSKVYYDYSPFDGYRYFEGQQFSCLIDLYIEQ